jgi:hypothetical protein
MQVYRRPATRQDPPPPQGSTSGSHQRTEKGRATRSGARPDLLHGSASGIVCRKKRTLADPSLLVPPYGVYSQRGNPEREYVNGEYRPAFPKEDEGRAKA